MIQTLKEKYITIIDGKNKTSDLIVDLRKLFSVKVYKESNIDKEFPALEEPTSRRFRVTQEADEDLKNKSADDLKRESIAGITLRERLLYELGYFEETGKHLDVKNETLCSGSPYLDGSVPFVRWRSGRLEIDWTSRNVGFAHLRSRQVIS